VKYMEALTSQWEKIVGEELAEVTKPLSITGDKARRLLVQADKSAAPPCGGWTCRSEQEVRRRTFNEFRASTNRAIAPHMERQTTDL